MKKAVASFVVAAILLALAVRSARADEVDRTWYGWQIMLADAVTLVVSAQAPTAAYALPFDGALVHLANGEGIRALESVGVRAGGIFTGFAIGAALGSAALDDCRSECDFAPVIYGIIGAGVGLSVAAAIDWGVLAWKDAPPLRREFAVKSVGFAPHAGGGVVAVGGTF